MEFAVICSGVFGTGCFLLAVFLAGQNRTIRQLRQENTALHKRLASPQQKSRTIRTVTAAEQAQELARLRLKCFNQQETIEQLRQEIMRKNCLIQQKWMQSRQSKGAGA